MAIVLDKIAVEICKGVVVGVSAMLNAFDDLEAAKEQMDGISISLPDFDAVIGENGNVQHATGEVYEGVLNLIVAPLVAYLKATSVSGKTYWNWLQSVRKDGTQ